jgi:hypothetical protein
MHALLLLFVLSLSSWVTRNPANPVRAIGPERPTSSQH